MLCVLADWQICANFASPQSIAHFDGNSVGEYDAAVNVQWLGLRPSQALEMPWLSCSEPLSSRDRKLCQTLKLQKHIRQSQDYLTEIEYMEQTGKHEIQVLFSHPEGIEFLCATYLPTVILQHQYI